MPKLDLRSPGFVGVVGGSPSGPIQISILGGVSGSATNFNSNQVGLNDFANSFYTTSNGLIEGLSVTKVKVGTGTGNHVFSVINSSTGAVLSTFGKSGAASFVTLPSPILITAGMSLNIACQGQSTARPFQFVSPGGGTRIERDIGNGPYPTMSSPIVGDFLICTGCSIGWEIEME